MENAPWVSELVAHGWVEATMVRPDMVVVVVVEGGRGRGGGGGGIEWLQGLEPPKFLQSCVQCLELQLARELSY